MPDVISSSDSCQVLLLASNYLVLMHKSLTSNTRIDLVGLNAFPVPNQFHYHHLISSFIGSM